MKRNSHKIIGRYLRLGKEFVHPLYRVVVTLQRTVVESRRNQLHIKLLCKRHYGRPQLCCLGGSHIGLVLKIRLIESKDIQCLWVSLFPSPDVLGIIITIPNHRTPVHAELTELSLGCLGRNPV